MVLCIRGGEANSFFMGGRECEDGEGERGRRCEVGFGYVYCFEGVLSGQQRFCSICGLYFLSSHFLSLFLTCRIIVGHSIFVEVGTGYVTGFPAGSHWRC